MKNCLREKKNKVDPRGFYIYANETICFVFVLFAYHSHISCAYLPRRLFPYFFCIFLCIFSILQKLFCILLRNRKKNIVNYLKSVIFLHERITLGQNRRAPISHNLNSSSFNWSASSSVKKFSIITKPFSLY